MSVSTCQSKTLSAVERQYILLTQQGLPIVAKPYHWLAKQLNISVAQVLTLTEELKSRGVIRRIAAVPNHYKLGYNHNGMTVWDINDQHAQQLGAQVGALPFVSHCYLRPRHLPGWNYNLFAMVHGKSAEEIQHYQAQIKELVKESLVNRQSNDVSQSSQLSSNDMLISSQILKKTGLRLNPKS